MPGMKRDAPILIVLTVVIALGLLATGRDGGNGKDGHPDLTGNWEVNLEKSRFGKMPVPTRMTLQVSRRGSTLHSVQTTYDQSGGPDAVEGDWYLDGKERSQGSDGKIVATSRWNGNILESERKSKDGAYDELLNVKISGDRKVATENIKLKSPNGSNVATLIWERK